MGNVGLLDPTLQMDPVGGKYFENMFIGVMVEGMILTRRRWTGNADIQGKNLDTRMLGVLAIYCCVTSYLRT